MACGSPRRGASSRGLVGAIPRVSLLLAARIAWRSGDWDDDGWSAVQDALGDALFDAAVFAREDGVAYGSGSDDLKLENDQLVESLAVEDESTEVAAEGECQQEPGEGARCRRQI